MARRVKLQSFAGTYNQQQLLNYGDLSDTASLGGTSIGTAAASLVVLTGVWSTDYVKLNNNTATIQTAVNAILTALT